MQHSFAEKLYEWHETIERGLPWKETRDPYLIWVSEIILQQTRVEQGMPYYHRFIERFPNVSALANADEDDLLAVWKGLGYYSRARNMHKAARVIKKELGSFPSSYDSILALPGVGPYTAAAISSFAFDEPYPVIDGNVKRVITRYFGIQEPIDTSSGEKLVKQKLELVFDRKDPSKFNQAIMDFGALKCKPKNPICQDCPMVKECKAYIDEMTDRIPFKVKKLKKSKRFFHYFIVTIGDRVVLRKRTAKDIWRGLYEPLLMEERSGAVMEKSRQEELLNGWILFKGLRNGGETINKKQLLSHQEIHATFYPYHFEEGSVEVKVPVELVNLKNLSNFAVPKVVDWYLTDFSIPLE